MIYFGFSHWGHVTGGHISKFRDGFFLKIGKILFWGVVRVMCYFLGLCKISAIFGWLTKSSSFGGHSVFVFIGTAFSPSKMKRKAHKIVNPQKPAIFGMLNFRLFECSILWVWISWFSPFFVYLTSIPVKEILACLSGVRNVSALLNAGNWS